MSQLKYCPNCGAPIIPNAKYCANCGANLAELSQAAKSQEPAPAKPRNAGKQHARESNPTHHSEEESGRPEPKQQEANKQAASAPQSNQSEASEQRPNRQAPIRAQRQQASARSQARSSVKKVPRRVWIVLAVAVVLIFLFVQKPWVPRGESDPDKVMAWSYNHDDDILREFEMYNGDEVYGHRHVVIVMENTKTNTFVFRYRHHYVYLIRIIEPDADMYSEQAVGISKDSSGNVYHHGLATTEMDSLDSNSENGAGWNPIQFVRIFEGGEE